MRKLVIVAIVILLLLIMMIGAVSVSIKLHGGPMLIGGRQWEESGFTLKTRPAIRPGSL